MATSANVLKQTKFSFYKDIDGGIKWRIYDEYGTIEFGTVFSKESLVKIISDCIEKEGV